MNILCVGDVVGEPGCAHLQAVLPKVKRDCDVDVCIVNGENSACGNGMLPKSAEALFQAGADVITGGNHTIHRREVHDLLDREPMVLRPYNYPAGAPGHGLAVVDRGRYQVTVINLLGTVFMDPLGNPFEALDRALSEAGNPKFCVVDFHAEATAEKKGLAMYADGRISALFGTHTHVQTADEQVLPKGTGFLTDVGMTAPTYSVLGMRPDEPIERMRLHTPARFMPGEGACQMDAVLFTLDDQTGKTTAVKRLQIR